MRESNYKIEDDVVWERVVLDPENEADDGWRKLKTAGQIFNALQNIEKKYNTAVFNLERGREEMAKLKEYVRGIETMVRVIERVKENY